MLASTSIKQQRLARRIAHRTTGHRHGPITRLMSPGDIGELVKPFVFLDYFEVDRFDGPGFADHPHSGIATHTTLLEGRFAYRDSTGESGVLEPGSVEWMQAGGGVWHGGTPARGERQRGYQLWVALPPSLEHAPARSSYVDAARVAGDGRVRVLLGSYAGMRSEIEVPSPMTYLHVRLEGGETWQYVPAPGHDLAWLAVHKGSLHVGGELLTRELAVLEEGDGPVEVRAEGETELVIASAVKHPHPLVCGSYSVHTSVSALVTGEAGIRRVAASLGAGGLRGWLGARGFDTRQLGGAR